MALFSLMVYQWTSPKKKKNLKNITTNTKGTNASWDILRKVTSMKKEGFNAISTILHMRVPWGIDMQ